MAPSRDQCHNRGGGEGLGWRNVGITSVAEAYIIDETGVVADIRARYARRRLSRRYRVLRIAVATLVTIAHIAVVMWMVATKFAPVKPPEKPVKTQLLWLLLPRNAIHPGVERPNPAEEMLRQAYKAVQLLPKVESPQPTNNAITLDPGLSLGQAIACGAGSFEYLTPEGQRRCRSKPWNFTYDRYGYIIMDTRGRAPKPQTEKKVNPRAKMQQQRNTAPNCPDGTTGPCIGEMLHGQ